MRTWKGLPSWSRRSRPTNSGFPVVSRRQILGTSSIGAVLRAHPEQSPNLVFVMADDCEPYRAIGEPESRNRRARTALLIQARLMSLGFGLAHRSHQFLATSTKNMERETGIEPATFSLGS